MGKINKKCPFCKRYLHKKTFIDYPISKNKVYEKIFCYKCTYSFEDVEGDIFFKFFNLKINIINKNIIFEGLTIPTNIDIYKEPNAVLEKIKLLIFK